MSLNILTVGINYYLSAPDLTHCVNDAKDWHTFLVSEYSDNIGKTKVLTTPDETYADDVLDNFKAMLGATTNNDLFIFVFSGHGVISEGKIEDEIVFEESLQCRDLTISEREISNSIKSINPEAKIILIFDSCYSGGIEIKNESFTRTTKNNFGLELKTYFQKLTREHIQEKLNNNGYSYRSFENSVMNNTIIISSCNKEQESWGIEYGNGLFTENALELLYKNHNITYTEFIDELKNNIELINQKQTPQLLSSNNNLNNKIIFANN